MSETESESDLTVGDDMNVYGSPTICRAPEYGLAGNEAQVALPTSVSAADQRTQVSFLVFCSPFCSS